MRTKIESRSSAAASRTKARKVSQHQFSSAEVARLVAAIHRPLSRGEISRIASELAPQMHRTTNAIRMKLYDLTKRRPNYSHPGVIIDDFGISYAQLMSELRDGKR